MNMIVSSAAFELAKLANGGDDYASLGKAINGQAIIAMTPEKAQMTLDFAKESMAKAMDTDELKKSVTLSTGATYYDLRAPSMLFSPTITPVRNSLKRTKRQFPGNAAHWKTITGLTNTPNLMGWVPEGRRAGSITYTMADANQSYATLGTEDSVTDEAKFAAEGFEDEEALIQMRSLYKTMQIEECGLLHGNASVALGTPTTPTVASVGSGFTLPTATYSVIVVALNALGYLQASLGAGVVQSVSVTSNDGQGAYSVNGGSSQKSAAASQAITLGASLTATVPVVNGAVAYAWYVGVSGSEKLEQITTINSAVFGVPLTGGSRQAATAITADCSVNSTAFDGLVTQAYKNSSVAYINTLATGTAGAGTQLTAVGNGEVKEIRDMLRAMWDQNRVSITKLYVAAQELTSLTKLVLTSGSSPLLRINSSTGDTPSSVKVTAGSVVGWYFNPYTADGGRFIPIIIHPNMCPGTIFGYAETLPATYMSNECPTVAEVLLRQDYYVEKWVRTSRTQFYGTYCQEAVAVYAPFCLAIITNIAPTT